MSRFFPCETLFSYDPKCEQPFFPFLLTVRYYLLEENLGGRSSIKVLAALPTDDLWGLLFLFNVVLFIVFVFLAVLGLWCCASAFSSCGEWGLLFVVMHRLVFVGAFFCCGAWTLGNAVSVVMAHRLGCSPAYEIFLDWGPNWCPLHW